MFEQDTIEKMKRLVQELEQKSQLLEIEAEKKRLKKENQQLATQLGTATAPIPTRAQIAMLLEVSARSLVIAIVSVIHSNRVLC